MFDALAPAVDALDAALAAGAGLARRRCGRAAAAAEAGRDATDPDARPQGPGQLPRRAQRRATRTRARRRRRCWSRAAASAFAMSVGDAPRRSGIVVVSHSRALARAAVALAEEMLHGKHVRIEVAAGLDDTHVRHRRRRRSSTRSRSGPGRGRRRADGPRQRGARPPSSRSTCSTTTCATRVVLCPAPLVEGLVVAAVAAAGGAGRDEVAAEARGRAGGQDRPTSASAPSRGREPTVRRRPPTSSTRRLHRGQPARAARPAGRPAGAGGARVSTPVSRLRNRTTGAGSVPRAACRRSPRSARCTATRSRSRASGRQAARGARPPARAGRAQLRRAAATPTAAPRPAGRRPAAGRPGRIGRVARASGSGRRGRCGSAPTDRPRRRRAGDPAVEWRRLVEAVAAVRREHRAGCAPAPPARSARPRRRSSTPTCCCSTTPTLLDDVARAGSTTGRPPRAAWAGRRRTRSPPSWPRCPTRTCGPAPTTSARSATRCCAQLLGASRRAPPRPTRRPRRRRPDARPRPPSSTRPGRRRSCSPTAARTSHSAILAAGAGHPGGRRRRARRARRRRTARSSRSTAARGEVVVDPPADVRAELPSAGGRRSPASRRAARRAAAAPAVTRDGVDGRRSARTSARWTTPARPPRTAPTSPGLVRTEFLFLGRDARTRRRRAGGGLPRDRRGARRPADHVAHPRRRRRQAAALPADARRGEPVPRGARASGCRWRTPSCCADQLRGDRAGGAATARSA